MLSGNDEGVDNQVPTVGIDEQGRYAEDKHPEKPMGARYWKALGINRPPGDPSPSSGRKDNEEQDSYRPRSMQVDPQSEERRQRPQVISAVRKLLQDDQLADEAGPAKHLRPRPQGDRCEQNEDATGKNRGPHIS